MWKCVSYCFFLQKETAERIGGGRKRKNKKSERGEREMGGNHLTVAQKLQFNNSVNVFSGGKSW